MYSIDWFCVFHISKLKKCDHKYYISSQKKGVGETNILQHFLRKSVDRFCRYGHLFMSKCLTMAAAIL